MHAQELLQLGVAPSPLGGVSVKARRSGDVDALGLLTQSGDALCRVARGHAMDVGELGDGMPDAFVDGPAGDLAPVQVHDRHPGQHERRHQVQQLPSVTEDHQAVHGSLSQQPAGTQRQGRTLQQLGG